MPDDERIPFDFYYSGRWSGYRPILLISMKATKKKQNYKINIDLRGGREYRGLLSYKLAGESYDIDVYTAMYDCIPGSRIPDDSLEKINFDLFCLEPLKNAIKNTYFGCVLINPTE